MLRIFSCLVLVFCWISLVAAQTKKVEPKDKAPQKKDDRAEYLAEALNTRIATLDKGEVALLFLLDVLGDLATPQGADKNPDLKVTIRLDLEAFRKQSDGKFDAERVEIKFPLKLIGVPLRVALQIVGDQLDAVLLVRKGSIEFVPKQAAIEELKLKLKKDEPFPTLVHQFYSKTPLETCLRQIRTTYLQNVELSPAAAAKKDFAITTRLVNVPLESAVEKLAAMADLQVVRKANVLYVTTKEQAAQMIAEQKTKEREKPVIEEKKEK